MAKAATKTAVKPAAKATQGGARRAKLVAAVEELNDQLGLDPAIDTSASIDELVSKIKETISVLNDDDQFSEKTTEVLESLGWKAESASQEDEGEGRAEAEPEQEAEGGAEGEDEPAAETKTKPANGRAAKPAKEKPAKAAKPAKSDRPKLTFTGNLTNLLVKGGTVKDIAEAANAEVDRFGVKPIHPVQVRGHAKYLEKNGKYTVKTGANDFIQIIPVAVVE